MAWCGCEDYPCCGHDASAVHPSLRQYCAEPEDAEAWFDALDPEEQEFAEHHLTQCDGCGEYTNPANLEAGLCALCLDDPIRTEAPQAHANHGATIRRLREEVEALREELAELRERQHEEVTT